MLLDDLLQFIPSDTEARVRRARERFNQNIREVLRQETGLRLRRSSRDVVEQVTLFGEPASQPVSADQITVRVELVPGLPLALREKEVSDKDRLAALIAPWRDSLERLRDSAEDAEHLVGRLSADADGLRLITAGSAELQSVVDLAERLLRESARFNLAKWILDVQEDVLGSYRYTLPDPRRPFERRRHDPWIELYWAVIGLFARLIVVDIEDLTVVVLAHELAHAYTHLGTDIDGHAWTPTEFAASDHPLKEGLAQLYSSVVCQRLNVGAPRAAEAFERLLRDQPPAYHAHVQWEKKRTPEELRLALLQVRRSGAGKIVRFEEFLQTAQKALAAKGQKETADE
jgi:hypothetical protein